ncbi:mitochondrial amidoxime-reducing component 1-like [Neosynchiropus ocellatus]
MVSKLNIHPVKSGKPVSVTIAECLNTGLRCGELGDRQWLVVTEDGHMVTSRQQPRLVLVSMTAEGSNVVLNGPNMDELKFPANQPENKIMDCRVFGDDIQGRDCGDQVTRWLTEFLAGGRTFHLVRFEPQMEYRKPWVENISYRSVFPKTESVMYPDIGAVMLLSEASVDDLSSKMDKQLTVERFRPNIVVAGCGPFDEDSWTEIQIGDVRLRRVMSCMRCISTTVDPETGIMSRKEPLETMKSYRQCKDKSEARIYHSAPLFGQVHTVKKTGTLHVGDLVFLVTH